MISATWRIRLSPAWWPKRVVDRLEAVDVDDHHRPLAAVAGAEGDVLVELGAETATVEQPCKRVVIGEIAQLGLGLFGLLESFVDDLAVLGVEFREHRLDRRIALNWQLFARHPVKVELSTPNRIALHA